MLYPDLSPGGLLGACGGRWTVAHKTVGHAFRMALLLAHLQQHLWFISIPVEAVMQCGGVTWGHKLGNEGKMLGGAVRCMDAARTSASWPPIGNRVCT